MPIVEEFDVETSEGVKYTLYRYSPLEVDQKSPQFITRCGYIAEEVMKGLYSIFLPAGAKLAVRLEPPPKPIVS